MAATRVVVVEDEHLIRRKLALGLVELGFEVFEASDAYACRAVMRREAPDVVLLDLGLPGIDGLTFLRELRGNRDLAVIVTTREDASETVIRALDLGCDDFVVKPVHVGEIAARVRSVLRRRQGGAERLRRLGPWLLDLEARTAHAAHGEALLTRGEFDILRELVKAGGRIVSRGELIRAVSRTPEGSDPRTVDSLVSRLRRKLATPDEPQADLIATAPGLGYRLTAPAEPAGAS